MGNTESVSSVSTHYYPFRSKGDCKSAIASLQGCNSRICSQLQLKTWITNWGLLRLSSYTADNSWTRLLIILESCLINVTDVALLTAFLCNMLNSSKMYHTHNVLSVHLWPTQFSSKVAPQNDTETLYSNLVTLSCTQQQLEVVLRYRSHCNVSWLISQNLKLVWSA